MNRSREAAERFADRRRREDEAPRLRELVPRLTSCKIEIDERRDGMIGAEVKHTRRIVVEHAPALFLVACGNSACVDGGHDITGPILRGLREGQTEIEGEDVCHGHTGSSACGRIVRFTAHCEYDKS